MKTYLSRYKKRDIRINNMYQTDTVNLYMACIPAEALPRVQQWADGFRVKANERLSRMLAGINKKYKSYGIRIDFDRDVLPLSLFAEGGTATEYHLIAALAKKLVERFGRGQILLRFLTHELKVTLTEKMKSGVLDVSAGARAYLLDIANVLKPEIKNFYIDAADERCSILEFLKMAKEVSAIAVYPYMGDIISVVMGEYYVEKYEDSFLEELIEELKALGVQGVSYEPSRLKPEQLSAIRSVCERNDMLQLSGETVYTPQQSFEDATLEDIGLSYLAESGWALAGSCKATETDTEGGIMSRQTVEKYPELSTRILIYSNLGKYGKIKES
jgi:hypothetical protein